MRGTIITVGDEILIGQIVDTNSAWLGKELSELGVEVVKIITISDTHKDIKDALDLALSYSDLVIMTGGLGPTKDDITKKAICEYVESDLFFDEALANQIETYFKSRNIPFIDAHRQQCMMPKKAKSLQNKLGTAPGMLFELDGKYILSMPGVPYEMKWIFSNSFKDEYEKIKDQSIKIYHQTIKTIGMGESRIAEVISDIIDDLPEGISMAYLPSLGEVKLRLTSKSQLDQSALVDEYIAKISERIPKLIYGYNNISIAQALQELCISKGLTIATAESCTGGYLAHKLTEVPGSSAYYYGSIIAYDYDPKKRLLNVSPDTLEKYGAVSQETVEEMLRGLLEKFGTNLGIAISGIAGPGGGLPDKPVGTIWMAYGTTDNIKTKKLQLGRDRLRNIQYTAVASMNLLRKFVNEIEV